MERCGALLGFLAATALTFGPGPSARAARVESVAPAGSHGKGLQLVTVPARLDGGTRISFSVTLPREELDEAEVYLSLDGGRTFPIRLSEEERARHAVTFDIQLPNLSAESAQVMVRAGGRTKAGHVEVEIARSRTFEITPSPRAPSRKPWADRGIRKRIGDHSHVEWWFTRTAQEPVDLPADGLRGTGRLEAAPDAPEGALSRPVVRGRRISGGSPLAANLEIVRALPGAPAPLIRIRLQQAAGPLPLRI